MKIVVKTLRVEALNEPCSTQPEDPAFEKHGGWYMEVQIRVKINRRLTWVAMLQISWTCGSCRRSGVPCIGRALDMTF